jgi:hypothetical protein
MTTKRITVNLPEDQIQFLQDVAKKENLTFTVALSRAINSERFFVQQEGAGHKILVEESGRCIREVVRSK